MSSLYLFLYAVGGAADTYCIVYKIRVFVVISGEKAQKKNKFSENMFFLY
jgi:hypothetical protein